MITSRALRLAELLVAIDNSVELYPFSMSFVKAGANEVKNALLSVANSVTMSAVIAGGQLVFNSLHVWLVSSPLESGLINLKSDYSIEKIICMN